MNRKGFTLVELLMVVIIIGILVTLAIPNYFQSVERAKGAAAKSVLDNLRKAELQYRAINDIFINDGGVGGFAELNSFDIPAKIVAAGTDGDWTYNCEGATTDVVSCKAQRNTNAPAAFQNDTITMDQDGTVAFSDSVYQ